MTKDNQSQAPPPEITYNAIYVLFDVAQNAIDFHGMLEFLKANPRKEIEFINALDYIDQRSGKNAQSTNDMVAATVKNLRSKLDAEIAKNLDAKKKFYQALEKQRQQLEAAAKRAKGKKPTKSTKSQKPVELLVPEEPKYDGKADVLFVIYNIGFSVEQIEILRKGGFPFVGFIALVPDNPEIKHYVKPDPKELEELQQQQKEAAAQHPKGKASPKHSPTLPLIETSFINSPDCYPPARWDALRPELGNDTLFRELRAGQDFANVIQSIENEVVRMINANDSYDSFNERKSFIEIQNSTNDIDTSVFSAYLDQHPRDYVNGLWMQLKAGNFSSRPHVEPEVNPDLYSDLFQNGELQTARKVVYQSQAEPEQQQFTYPFIPQVYFYLYRLIHWKPKEENAKSAEAIFKFIERPGNYYAYAGSKFDIMIQAMNKKYQLGLPNSFYDFQQWNLATEHSNAAQVLAEATHDAACIDTIFDDDVGMLWMMVMKPVTKNVGQFVVQYSMPQTLLDMSEWMTNVYDHRNDEEKKIKTVNPAIAKKDKLDSSFLLPPLQQRINSTDKYFRMPLTASNDAHFRTPYFMDNGMHAQVTRDLVSDKLTFSYSLYFDEIEITSTDDSIVYQPAESICFYNSTKEFGITIFFNEQMIYYDGKNLILTTVGSDERMLITLSGSLILNKEKMMIVEPNGAISTKVDDQWEYCDKDGETYINWHKVDRPHSYTKDLTSQITTMIRPDRVEYYVLKNGNRKITVLNSINIEQSDKAVDFDIPTFPFIHVENEVISIKIDRFELEFKGTEFLYKCSDYTINVSDITSKVKIRKSELNLNGQRCEVKLDNTIFVADADGTEKMGTLLSEEALKKKRNDTIETSFGKIMPNKETNPEPVLLDLHTKFPARFFAIRSDFSVTEFLRPDTLPKLIEKRVIATHPTTGERFKLLSIHGRRVIPSIYIDNEPLSKPARSALLKEIKIPKATKKQPVVAEAPIKVLIKTYFEDLSLLMTLLNNRLATLQNEYLHSIAPKPQKPPEKLFVPPQTPPPRIQLMQYDLYQPVLGAGEYNYWTTHYSDFGYPLHEKKKPERPLESRTQLFDAPRLVGTCKEKDIPEYIEESYDKISTSRISDTSFITQPTVPMKYRDYDEEDDTKPKVVRISPQAANFGNVKVGKEKDIKIILTNAGTRPIHYAFTEIQSEYLKVMTIPGVVFPGLKIIIQIHLSKVPKPQTIESSFMFTSKNYNFTIPVSATIVP